MKFACMSFPEIVNHEPDIHDPETEISDFFWMGFPVFANKG